MRLLIVLVVDKHTNAHMHIHTHEYTHNILTHTHSYTHTHTYAHTHTNTHTDVLHKISFKKPGTLVSTPGLKIITCMCLGL